MITVAHPHLLNQCSTIADKPAKAITNMAHPRSMITVARPHLLNRRGTIADKPPKAITNMATSPEHDYGRWSTFTKSTWYNWQQARQGHQIALRLPPHERSGHPCHGCPDRPSCDICPRFKFRRNLPKFRQFWGWAKLLPFVQKKIHLVWISMYLKWFNLGSRDLFIFAKVLAEIWTAASWLLTNGLTIRLNMLFGFTMCHGLFYLDVWM